MNDIKKRFFDITGLIQAEFDRNMEMYGEKIQCRRGCSKCCSQIFHITPVDGWIIQQHVRSMPPEEREALKQKARDYILKASSATIGSDEAENHKVKGEPCPALGFEGECTIYEARPVICRRFGMPIYDYKNPANVYACELNFKDGDEITDDKLVPNQTLIGKQWDELKDEFGGGSTTIAEAINEA
jgi:Fe-S-cluster containining protein